MGSLKANTTYIYESPDDGKTVYAREHGSNERRLVGYKYDCNLKKQQETLLEIIKLSEENPALKKALENLFLVYNLVKDETKNEILWHPV